MSLEIFLVISLSAKTGERALAWTELQALSNNYSFVYSSVSFVLIFVFAIVESRFDFSEGEASSFFTVGMMNDFFKSFGDINYL